MKILMFSLLLALGLNANETVYGSKSGNAEGGAEPVVSELLELKHGEALQILNVSGYSIRENGGRSTMSVYINTQYEGQESAMWQRWNVGPFSAYLNDNDKLPLEGGLAVGPCKVQLVTWDNYPSAWQVSYKLIKPAAANTTTSAPILLPPTPNAAASWFVKLQMSSDLKTWEDVQAGQFLGSDAARFFRIQTTAAE